MKITASIEFISLSLFMIIFQILFTLLMPHMVYGVYTLPLQMSYFGKSNISTFSEALRIIGRNSFFFQAH